MIEIGVYKLSPKGTFVPYSARVTLFGQVFSKNAELDYCPIGIPKFDIGCILFL